MIDDNIASIILDGFNENSTLTRNNIIVRVISTYRFPIEDISRCLRLLGDYRYLKSTATTKLSTDGFISYSITYKGLWKNYLYKNDL